TGREKSPRRMAVLCRGIIACSITRRDSLFGPYSFPSLKIRQKELRSNPLRPLHADDPEKAYNNGQACRESFLENFVRDGIRWRNGDRGACIFGSRNISVSLSLAEKGVRRRPRGRRRLFA